MARKIFKMCDSLVISLPEDVVVQLGLQEGDEVFVSADATGGRLIARPKHFPIAEIDHKFAKQLEEFIEKYGPALEALSK